MNCDCSDDIEAKLKERLVTQKPDSTDHKVKLLGYGFGITDSGVVINSFMEYEAYSLDPIKKGGHKPKKSKGNMLFSFCPFCGVKA